MWLEDIDPQNIILKWIFKIGIKDTFLLVLCINSSVENKNAKT